MTVLEIVKDWLKDNGFDGLYWADDFTGEETCGCDLDDFAPCGDMSPNCITAYRHKNGLMYPTKPEASDENNKAPYGYCPLCNKPGITRERRPDGDDTCVNGHKYKSSTAMKHPPAKGRGTR